MQEIKINGQRYKETFDELSQFGLTGRAGCNRPALSDADKGARDQFAGG